ncbi:chloride channel protein CLC-b-like [Bidens hawaiensis]|uniref:chloride channel protein CLC-b-like n=1 Tax=Bidens hawaiensis TaxID=980011 RepID=UPI00404A9FA2
MEKDLDKYAANTTTKMEEQTDQKAKDPDSDTLHEPLLKRNQTLSSSPLALIGTRVSCNESLDYEINENDLFKHDWRTRSQAQVLQYVFVKWLLAFLVGLLTGIITTLINLAIENIAGYKLLAVVNYIERKRYMTGFLFMTLVNFILTLFATLLCVFFAPTAAGPGIPEIKAYLNGVDTPDMYGATTMFVKKYCKTGECGLYGEGGLIMFDVSGVSVKYHVVDLIPVTVIGIIGGVLGSLYNYLLHKVLRLYNVINAKGKLAKILLSLTVSLFTSVCLYGLPFLASCTPCNPSAIDSECPTTGRMGNFKKFNCPKGHYNDLATLLLTTSDDAVRNIFSTSTPGEYSVFSLLIFFALYCILGLFTFGIAVPSGLFLPIILMGSAYGRLLGMAMGPYTTIDEGLYAVLGAASLMAGSMRMTVSLCVIFLELTNNLLLLPITMLVLLISKTVGDCFNPSIYEIILELKGLPFLEGNPEPWMRNITVGELADIKSPLVTLSGIEKVGRIVDVLRNTTHNAFAVVDTTMVPGVGQMSEFHGLILRAHLLLVLKKKWFLKDRRRTDEWEVREKFTWVDVAERWGTIEDVAVTKQEMEMYVDLHPLTNTTPFTVVETMLVAKALVQFRQVGLRHMLVLPKFHGPTVPPVVGILTRQDLRAHNILSAFPHLEKSYETRKVC